jgi:transposase
MVRARGDLIRCTRSLLRSEGHLLPSADTDDFAARLGGTWGIPEGFEEPVVPLVEAIDGLTQQVLAIEGEIEKATAEEAPTLRLLKTIPGVGHLTATAFMALIEDPSRFRHSSEVAAYLGLAPWVNESAGKRREGGITKRGNKATRALLVQAAWAHVRSRMNTALKQWFRKLEGRIGRKKAITALARKIGELMWTLWRKGVSYSPFPLSSRRSLAPT